MAGVVNIICESTDSRRSTKVTNCDKFHNSSSPNLPHCHSFVYKKPHHGRRGQKRINLGFSFNGPLLCEGFRARRAWRSICHTTARPRSPLTVSHHSPDCICKCCDKENFGRSPGGGYSRRSASTAVWPSSILNNDLLILYRKSFFDKDFFSFLNGFSIRNIPFYRLARLVSVNLHDN